MAKFASTFFLVVAIAIILSVATALQFKPIDETATQIIIDKDALFPVQRIELVDMNEFVPNIPLVNDYDALIGRPEDEEVSVSSIGPEVLTPIFVPEKISVERTVSMTLDGKMITDVKTVTSDLVYDANPIVTDLKIIPSLLKPIDVHDLIINQNPIVPSGTGIYTGLNLNALSNAIRQIVNPILNSFIGKKWVVFKSWPYLDITIQNLGISTLNMGASNGRVTVSVAVTAVIKVYIKTKLLGSASALVSLTNYALTAGANVGVSTTKKVLLSNIGVTAAFGDYKFHTSGGLISRCILKVASVLLHLKTIIRLATVQILPQALQGAITTASLNMVNTVPWKGKIGKWGAAINLGVNEIKFPGNNVIVVGFAGNTLQSSTNNPFPHNVPARHSITYTHNPAHLFGIMVDSFVINDFVSSWYSNTNHKTLYTRTTRPSWLTDLNTLAWNIIFPGIGDNHPNANLVLEVKLTAVPSLSISGNVATFSAAAEATWAIDNGMGQIGEPLVTIGLNLSTGLNLSMKYELQQYALVPKLTSINPTFTAKMTIIGPIDMSKVNSSLNAIINNIIVPLVDLALSDGIAIPSTSNFQLTTPVISFTNNAILVGSGVNISF